MLSLSRLVRLSQWPCRFPRLVQRRFHSSNLPNVALFKALPYGLMVPNSDGVPYRVVAGGVLFRLALSFLVLVTSGRLEASDGASIHRCQPGNVGFPKACDGASIHRDPPGNVGFPRSIRWGEHPSRPT